MNYIYVSIIIIDFFFSFQTQFFIVTIHNSQFLFMDCKIYPWIFIAFIQGFTTIVAVLFLNFYIQTYRKKPAPKKEQKSLKEFEHANGFVPVENGGHIANGYVVSGRVSKETIQRRHKQSNRT